MSYVIFCDGNKLKIKVYFTDKLSVTSTVKLEKNMVNESNNMVDEFDRELQDHGDVEKVRVNMITSPGMQYKSDWFFVARYGQINAFFAV